MTKRRWAFASGLSLLSAACASSPPDAPAASDAVPEAAGVSAITQAPWREAVVSVRDLDASARFFLEIGGYEVRHRGPIDPAELAYWGLPEAARGEALVIAPPGSDHGLIRLVDFEGAGARAPMRPGARSWDKGCYFSLMIRMKNVEAIYDDALAMGWWTETPITDLDFGTSKLKVVIYRGPDGLQVQGYERLSPPLPAEIPAFERMTQPFNMMQMVADRDASRAFYEDVLGFQRFYVGKPYLAKAIEASPIGIPLSLSTSVRYRAGIYYPMPGEFGRMETIEVMDIDGYDHSDRCRAPNYGILAVRFEVEDAEAAARAIVERGGDIARPARRVSSPTTGAATLFGVDTPDGAMIDFFDVED